MKAIVVFDMPHCCGACRLMHHGFPYGCNYTGKQLHVDNLCSHRNKDCPLKPLPDKSKIEETDNENMKHYKQGINDTLARINGELMQTFSED